MFCTYAAAKPPPIKANSPIIPPIKAPLESLEEGAFCGRAEVSTTIVVGDPEGATVGPEVGLDVGFDVGPEVGPAVGPAVGPEVGPEVGPDVGPDVGTELGYREGISEGTDEGLVLGAHVGEREGAVVVGAFVTRALFLEEDWVRKEGVGFDFLLDLLEAFFVFRRIIGSSSKALNP